MHTHLQQLQLYMQGPVTPNRPSWKHTLLGLGGRLIDVRLFAINVFGYNLRLDWGRKFLMLAARHSMRWRSFTLKMVKAYTRDVIMVDGLINSLRNLPVPQLRHVDVSIDHPLSYAMEAPQIFLQGTPHLSTLKLNTTMSYWLLVPMKTITTLIIQFDSTPIPIMHLPFLPNLRHFAITRRKSPNHHCLEFDLLDDPRSRRARRINLPSSSQLRFAGSL